MVSRSWCAVFFGWSPPHGAKPIHTCRQRNWQHVCRCGVKYVLGPGVCRCGVQYVLGPGVCRCGVKYVLGPGVSREDGADAKGQDSRTTKKVSIVR